jgi:cytoskeletal protein RodZ
MTPNFLRESNVAPFGEFLRGARERRGLTLQQIAQETKIPLRLLQALEHGNLGAVPNDMYRRAEIRAYAQVVGLDQRVALSELERAVGSVPARGSEAESGGASASYRRPVVVAGVIVVAAAGAWSLATWSRQSAPATGARTSVTRAAAAQPQPVTRAAIPQPQRVAPNVPTPRPGTAVAPPPQSASIDQAVRPPADLDGEIVVTTDPAGARVTVNGIGRGMTPVTVRFVPFGTLRIRVIKDGYVSEERVVRLTSESPTTEVAVPLRAAQ